MLKMFLASILVVLDSSMLSFFVARFQLIQRAKSVLTEPETRRFYDAWLQDDMEMSFEEWIQMRQRFRMVGACQRVGV